MQKSDLARIRTWNLLIRSQTRYPLRHKALIQEMNEKMVLILEIFPLGQEKKAQTGFEPVIFGLRDRRLTTWPLRQLLSLYFPAYLSEPHCRRKSKRKKVLAAVGFEPTPPKRLVP